MDDTTKGENDKRSWRERLGIGTKEMPKISNDFKSKDEAPENQAPAAGNQSKTEKSSPRSEPPKLESVARPAVTPSAGAKPAVVARPAPMAPRPAPKPIDENEGVARPAPPPAPVVRPAPMARPPQPAATAPGRPPSAPQPTAQPVKPPQQVGQPSLSPDALANRLKAQREAAEKLAEQRIQVARQRAEAAAKSEQSSRGQPGPQASSSGVKPKFTFAEDDSAEPSQPAMQVPLPQAAPPMPGRPIAPPNLAPPKQSGASMSPPRQPLGADRMPVRPAASSYTPTSYPHSAVPDPVSPYAAPGTPGQLSYGAYPPPPYSAEYRPVDPVTGYSGPAPRPARGYPAQPLQSRQSPSGFQGEEEYGYTPPPSRMRPSAPTRQATLGDPDDIFEQPVRGQRRPTAGEYRQAYQDSELGFEDEPQRSNAPWLLLLLLLAALAAAGAGAWFWQSMKPGQAEIAVQPATTQPTPPAPEQAEIVDTPVVNQPETAAKVPPDAPATPQAETTAATPVNAPSKKQIYDRIVGDQEVLGDASLAPSEVQPMEPEPATGQSGDTQPALQEQGTGGSEPLPVPPPEPAADQPVGNQGAVEPPPPIPGSSSGGGTLVATGKSSQISPAASTELELQSAPDPAAQPPPGASQATESAELNDVLPMPKDKIAAAPAASAASSTETGVAVTDNDSDAVAALAQEASQETPQEPESVVPAPAPSASSEAAKAFVNASQEGDDPSLSVPEIQTDTDATSTTKPSVSNTNDPQKSEQKPIAEKPKKSVKKSAQSEKTPSKKSQTKEQAALGAEPLVLVAPGQDGGNKTQPQDGIYGELPVENGQAQAEQPKRRTLLDLINPERAAANSAGQAEPQVASNQPQRKTLLSGTQNGRQVSQQPQEAAPQPAPKVGGGFLAQIATFRSQDEAQREYQRLKAQHSDIVGNLPPVINETSVGGSRRYRLAVGPVQSNATAGQLCARLLSAGERDCQVRRQ